MATTTAGPEIERLIQLLSRLPGLGPRSARRAALSGRDLEHVENPLNRIRRSCCALVDGKAPVVVLDHEVGEGSAGVDCKPHAGMLWQV